MKPNFVQGTVITLSSLMLVGLLGYAPNLQARDYGYYPRYDYYPRYNPVVRRDYYHYRGYSPDGSYHSENLVEDRRASYYSRGRNQAITRPRTTVDSWSSGPGHRTTREQTRWIGADGRPHSTTIERNTFYDDDGNSHTDTHVTLKKANKGNSE